MAGYILRRVLWLAPVLFFISLITFALMHSVEGGPWDNGERALPAPVAENLNREYGLDQPIWRQYADFAWNALHGDLGVSYQRQNRPVTAIILSGFKVTAVLGLSAFALAAAGGITLGLAAAVNRGGVADYAGVALATAGASVPGFVLGIFLVYGFSVKLHALPTFGWDLNHGILLGLLPRPQQMVMPVIALAALPLAYLARITRASMLEVLEQDYLRTARAKGLASSVVIYRHALRNALVPVVTVMGPMIAGLVTGSFIIEQLFSIPGTGRLFIQSVEARDYGMIMGATLFYAAAIAVANLAVDVAYAFVDPRIRYG
ncbi:MAG TPA: ABC transporter permease [Dehalococcoidia bacterium]